MSKSIEALRAAYDEGFAAGEAAGVSFGRVEGVARGICIAGEILAPFEYPERHRLAGVVHRAPEDGCEACSAILLVRQERILGHTGASSLTRAIKQAALRETRKTKPASVAARVVSLMADGKPRTLREICEATGAADVRVRGVLYKRGTQVTPAKLGPGGKQAEWVIQQG